MARRIFSIAAIALAASVAESGGRAGIVVGNGPAAGIVNQTCPNVIKNGGFEAAAKDWILSAGAEIIKDPKSAKKGASFARLTATEDNDVVTLAQRGIKVDQGQDYALSFWARGTFNEDEPEITIGADEYYPFGEFFFAPTEEQPIKTVLQPDSWTFFTYTLTAAALPVFVQFVIRCAETSGLLLDLDDIALRRISCTNPASSPPKVLLARGRPCGYSWTNLVV